MRLRRSTFLSLIASVAVPLLAIACGGADNDDASGSAADLSARDGGDAATPSDAVKVTAKIDKLYQGSCTIDISAPVVSIPSDKATENAINAVLAPISKATCENAGDYYVRSFEVTANGNGILSILVTGSWYGNGGAQGYNFDLKHGGKNLVLADVVTPAGMALQLDACRGQAPSASDAGDGGVSDFDDMSCRQALTSVPEDNIVPGWVARASGIELLTPTDHADGDFFTSTLSWSKLGATGLVAGTALAAYVEAVAN